MVSITDRPDMTSAVYHGRKAITQTKNKSKNEEAQTNSVLIRLILEKT